MSKTHIIPGKGVQYTPHKNIQWADQFDELMNQKNCSRNELISNLIEAGLKVQSGAINEQQGVFLNLEHFTSEQLSVLNTEAGKKILYNVVSLLLGDPNTSLVQTASIPVQDSNPIPSPPESEEDGIEQQVIKKKTSPFERARALSKKTDPKR